MHPNSLNLMEEFIERYVRGRCRVADVGSRDVNGSYRSLFAGHEYVGLDIEPGPNVDVVLPGLYEWGVAGGPYDVVASGQCVEHVPAPWRWIKSIAGILRPGGLACIVGPHTHRFHEYPIDCWRVYPDGLRALLEHGGFEILECRMSQEDTVGVGRLRSDLC